jgi:hypothetical protein
MLTPRVAIALFIASVCAGCASQSLTQNQCVAGDWQTVGQRDGQAGLATTQLLAHQEACGKFGLVPDRERYLLGWNDGVQSYCRADRGFELGASGSGHQDVCPADVREDFLVAYEQGRELYQARYDVNRLERALSRHRERLERIDARVLELAAAQVDTELTAAQRADLFAQTKNLVDERKRIEHDIPGIEFELGRAVARLDRLPVGR